jgi:hypothetical protein
MPECRIAVAAGKKYWMPGDPLYIPVQAGSAGAVDLGYVRDDSGENISGKNPWYSELTVLFWAWKNLEADYIGLTHYRRHFTIFRAVFGMERKKKAVLSRTQLLTLLDKSPVILPAPRRYYIENRKMQFARAHGAATFQALSSVIHRHFPDYSAAFNKTMHRSWGHICNLLVMRRDILDRYCSWLFNVLGKAEDELRKENGGLQPRILGYMGERLLDVWLEATGQPWRDIPYMMLEPVNWPLKIGGFLRRKFSKTERERDLQTGGRQAPAGYYDFRQTGQSRKIR